MGGRGSLRQCEATYSADAEKPAVRPRKRQLDLLLGNRLARPTEEPCSGDTARAARYALPSGVARDPAKEAHVADEILCSVDDGIATITLNRPEKRNAMNTAVLDGLDRYFRELETHPDVRVIVVRGEGTAFCAGLDLRELNARQHSDQGAESGIVDLLGTIETSRHPTIAVVQGDALAGGCELALHCDLRVASQAARFGMPLARLGLIVPFRLGQKLVEIIGPAFTKQILLTGQPVDARRAYEIGMIHRLVADDELTATSMTLARTIADNAPLSLSGMKRSILRMISLRDSLDHDDLDALVHQARKSADADEGVRAMLEKRKPHFRGV